MNNSNEYTILKDDCLSLIAKHFDVDINVLLTLNSTQIKNPDLIYEGNKLILSLPTPIITDNTRTPLPEAPTTLLNGNDTCQPKSPDCDILYVPALPDTGEKAWYAISDVVKEALLAEKETLSKAVVADDLPTTMKNLNALGILSKLAPKLHEHFMDAEDAEQYRFLLLAQLVINTRSFVLDGENPNEFLLRVSQKLDYNLWDKFRWISLKNSVSSSGHHSAMASLSAENNEKTLTFKEKVNQELKTNVLKQIAKNIESLEERAEKKANGVIAEDGTKFVYMKKLKYFSTTKQNNIANSIKTLNTPGLSSRPSELNLALSPHKECLDSISSWKESTTQAWDDWSNIDVNTSSQEQERIIEGSKDFVSAVNIRNLNLYGLAIKEQCLSPSKLTGDASMPITLGPKALGSDWRKGERGKAEPLDIKSGVIKELYIELGSAHDTEKPISLDSLVNNKEFDWAYYPTLALIKVVDATLIKHKSALAQVLNTGSTPLDVVFRQLLWIKQVALARLALLKSVAETNAAKGVNGLEFTFGDTDTMPSTFTLLWDEHEFTPKKVTPSGFINQAGYNNYQVVECCLLSDGEVFYVRSPDWYLPGKDERLIGKCAGHIKDITKKITVVTGEASGAQIVKAKDILKAIKDTNTTVQFAPLKTEKEFNSVFWQDSWHYQDESSQSDKKSAYSVDAGAQFLRFTTKSEASITSPLNANINELRNVGGAGSISANLTLLQGQLSVTCWLPLLDKNKGIPDSGIKDITPQEFNIPYQDKLGKEHVHPAGGVSSCIKGAVYGLAAASCQLSTKVTIGPTDVGSGFGIKGNTVGLFDPSVFDAYNLNTRTLTSADNAKWAAEAAAGIDVFAGIEAGGQLTSTVYWTPPSKEKTKEAQKLGSIEGKISAALGVGAQREFRLAIQGGVLLLIAEAGFIMGPGCSGKLAIAIDTDAADDFISCLLGVLKRSNFSRISLFGEANDKGINEDFILLNNLLTIAVATGLGVAKTLLLPFELWDDYQKKSLRQEYAPFLASNILVEDNERSLTIRKWVKKLPPETLGNLLNALAQAQTGSRIGNNNARIPAETDNQKQATAIVTIMDWLAADESESVEANQRQWKEALIFMEDLSEGDKDNKPRQWSAYKEQWFKLAEFINTHNKNDLRLILNFNRLSQKLCGNMILTRKTTLMGYDYFAYPKRCVSNASEGVGALAIVSRETGLAPNHWQLEKTDETIVNWDLYDIEF